MPRGKPTNQGPAPLLLEVRGYRLGSASLAYSSAGESVRRLADQILSDITGMSFPQLAARVSEYIDQREPEPEQGDGGPEPDQGQSR